MLNENEQRMNEKLEFFMLEQVEVHVQLKDKTFLNGIIRKKLKERVYWFIDRKLKGVYLFLKDVYAVEKFQEAGDEVKC